MDLIAHALWAGAAGSGKKNLAGRRIPVGWVVWWTMFPDLLAFGPPVTAALWLRLAGDARDAGAYGGRLPWVHFGLPLYQLGHSLVVFAVVYAVVSVVARRPVLGLLGWLLHILIDIPTHSHSYYATRFLWPLSDYRFDGISWRTPWFLACTYGALAIVYLLLWGTGRLSRPRRSPLGRSDRSASS